VSVASCADRLEAFARELGASVQRHTAATGTRYLAILREHGGDYGCNREHKTTVRVADHADAHGTADYTCDGVEGSVPGARAHILAVMGTSETALRRLRRARRRAGEVAT